jgi:hypothetical protein
MKTTSTQQEILLITGTSFSSRQYYQKTEQGKNDLNEKENLEEACWNGLLQYLLPEIYLQAEDKNLYLWKIKEAASFIEIELGELPEEKESYFSIDPYSFLPMRSLS